MAPNRSSSPTVSPGSRVRSGPVWSPDGGQIVYKNDLSRSGSPAKNELWVLTVALPQDPHRLAVGDAGSVVGSPAWGNR